MPPGPARGAIWAGESRTGAGVDMCQASELAVHAAAQRTCGPPTVAQQPASNTSNAGENNLACQAAPTVTPRHRGSHRQALSPSRAADFKRCPLLYRLRAIDRIPEVPRLSQCAVQSCTQPWNPLRPSCEERTAVTARSLIEPAWQRTLADSPNSPNTSRRGSRQADQRGPAAHQSVLPAGDPTKFTPEAVEHRIEMQLEDGTPCAASSTVSTSPHRRTAGGGLQDRKGRQRRAGRIQRPCSR